MISIEMNGNDCKCQIDVSMFKGDYAVADAAIEMKDAMLSVMVEEFIQLAKQTGIMPQVIAKVMCKEIEGAIEQFDEAISSTIGNGNNDEEIDLEILGEDTFQFQDHSFGLEDDMDADDKEVESLEDIRKVIEKGIDDCIEDELVFLRKVEKYEEEKAEKKEEEVAPLWYYDNKKAIIKRRPPYIYPEIEEKIILIVPTFLFKPEEIEKRLKDPLYIEKLEKYRKKELLREIEFHRLLNYISNRAEIMENALVKPFKAEAQ